MPSTGQLIRAARVAAGLSQKRLADVLALPGRNFKVSAWECDKSLPSPEQITEVARVLCVPSETLEGDGTRDDTQRSVGRPALSPEARKKNYKPSLNINGPIPEWIGYEELKNLICQYRGRMYDERNFKLWVEAGHPLFGKCPSRFDCLAYGTAVPNVRRRVYSWPAVKAWIASTILTEVPKGLTTTPSLANRQVNQGRLPLNQVSDEARSESL